jgi:hypothetical protein
MLSDSGTFEIRVHENANNETGEYAVTLERIIPLSPSATPIEFGETIVDDLVPKSDIDLFSFHGTAGDMVSASVGGVSTTDLCLNLFGPDGTAFESICGLGSERDTVHATLSESGHHVILITNTNLQAVSNGGTTTGYELSLQCMSEPCGVVDTDGDGVPDDEDICPLEDASGLDADQNGCIDNPQGLIDLINELPPDALDEQMKNSLISKITNAANQASKENICAAVNILEAFQNQVEAQRGKKISDETATLLISYADNLINIFLAELPTGESCN